MIYMYKYDIYIYDIYMYIIYIYIYHTHIYNTYNIYIICNTCIHMYDSLS